MNTNVASMQVLAPSLRDPRLTLLAALSTYTLLGQWILYFDIQPLELAASIVTCGVLDIVLTAILKRRLEVPLSGLITGLSLGILLESYDLRIFIVASVWAILSKYLLVFRGRHIFNPSNLGVVAALVLGHGAAAVAPGSQWGNHLLYAIVILCLGLLMMFRVGRLQVVLGWLSAFAAMGILRILAGQGGLVFALGPVTGAEFALFSFSMLPDPKTSPRDPALQFWWGAALGIVDGLLRLAEIKYSMFYALFALCMIRPLVEEVISARKLKVRPAIGD